MKVVPEEAPGVKTEPNQTCKSQKIISYRMCKCPGGSVAKQETLERGSNYYHGVDRKSH